MVKKTSSRGSAMLVVLVFITLVLVLGIGILSLADATVRQSRTLGISDNVYYSAESALQVYVQLVDERVRVVRPFSDPHDIAYSKLDDEDDDSIETWRSEYLTEIKEQLLVIYDDVKPAGSGNLGIDIDFYLGNVRLNLANPYIHSTGELALIGDTREHIKSEFERIMDEEPGSEDDYEGEVQTEVVFYPTKAITYNVTATIGGRTLVAYLGDASSDDSEDGSGTGDAIPDFSDTVFIRPVGGREGRDELLSFGSYDGGAYYKNNNINVYQALIKNADGSYIMSGSDHSWETIGADEKEQSYDGLINQLKYVITETDALTRDSVLGIVPGAADPPWELGTNNNARYIRANGNYILNGTYPNLEYLEVVNGSLTISGTVNCTKLKGVYVEGVSGTNAITILENAIFSGNSSVGGTIFLTKGRDIELNTGSGSTFLLDGKFLASGGDVTIDTSGGGAGNNKSNSMFVATKNGNSYKGKITTTGQNFRMAAFSAGQVPQYYAENDLLLHVQNNNASFEGIFATLSENNIFDDTVAERKLRGIFVGNCGKLRPNVRVLPFNPAQEDKMLPGGLFDAEGGGFIIVPGEVEIPPSDGSLSATLNEVTFDGVTKLVIRETTGDGEL